MNVRTVAIADINPAPYNPRVMLWPSDPAWDKIERSLTEFGLVEPLVWNERTGTLVAGHQRLRVLEFGGATEVDVSVVDLDIDREKALNIALNKIEGGWDEERLADVLADLSMAGLETLTGLDTATLERLLAKAPSDSELSEAAASASSPARAAEEHACQNCGWTWVE